MGDSASNKIVAIEGIEMCDGDDGVIWKLEIIFNLHVYKYDVCFGKNIFFLTMLLRTICVIHIYVRNGKVSIFLA